MSKQFTPSSKRNPCPICDDTSGDCRSLDTGLILCHSHIDTHQDPSHPNWKYIKPDRSGIWGIFTERKEEQAERGRDIWVENARKRKAEREKQKLERAKTALSIEDRDKGIRALSAEMGLTDGDRRLLLDRGLTDEQITAGLFFSYQAGQKVSDQIPSNLPGIRGGSLAGKFSGIACPAFDGNGLAIGYQIRLTETVTGGKYRWGYGQASSHLPNGELPLSIIKRDKPANGHIHLTEGILKPYAASCRLNINCIGAAGGNHAGSPEQLKNALDSLVKDESQFIVFMADAGAISNKNIIRQYQTTANQITEWGYGEKIRFGWWGQFDKTEGKDCDELGPDTEIEYLTFDEFDSLFAKQALRQNWRETKNFTAEIEINQQFVDFKAFEDKKIYFIKSGLGSGKTTNVRAWIDQNREWLHHNRLHFQGYRNNLLLQNCEGIPGLIHIHQFGECDYICDPDLWAAYCLDSILKFKPEDFDNGVIVIDEVVSVIKHLLFAKTEIARYREKAIKLFIESIKRARIVICMDGNLADWVVKFFKSIQTGKEFVTIENRYQTERPDLFWITGGLNSKGEISANNYSMVIDRVLNPASIGAKAVTSDSQTALQTIDSLLTKYGKRVLRIDSTTSGDEVVKAFLANPTQWLKDNPIDYLLYSPTAESGLDVPICDYFTAHYCLFFGVLDVDSTLQQIARIRDVNCPKYFWAREWSTNDNEFSSPIADALARVARERLNLDLQRALSGEVNGADIIGKILETYQTPFKAFEDTAFYLQAQRNYERSNYRECLLERIKIAGYNIIELEPEQSESAKIYKDEKETVLREEAGAIYRAEIKPVNKLNPDRIEDQRSLKKCKLLEQLPGIENDPIWSEDFLFTVLFKERQLMTQARRAWMLNHITVVNRLEREKFKRIYDRFFEDQHSLIWTERNEWGKLWALAECGIKAILEHPDREKVWGPDDPEIKNVICQCARKKIWIHLGRIGKTEIMQYVGRLLKMVGAQWEVKRAGREKADRPREYRLNQTQTERPEWEIITASLDKKWWKYTDTDLEIIDWAPPATYLENLAKIEQEKTMASQTPQIQSAKGFEAGPPQGGGLLQSDQSGGPGNVPENLGDKDLGNIEYIYGGLKVIDGGIEYQDLIAYNDRQFDQLEWPLADRQQFVHRLYGKKKRPLLSDSQLFDLVDRLDNLIAEGGF